MFSPGIEIKDGVIKITMFRIGRFVEEIPKVFKSSRMRNSIFKSEGMMSVELYEFFALELYYITELMLSNRRLSAGYRRAKQIRDLIKEHTWVKDVEKTYPSRLDYRKLDNMHFKPLPFQREFLEHYDKTVQQYKLKGLMLSAAAGTGKTNTSLSLAECLDADRVIIVAPKPAVYRVWEASIEKTPEEGGVFKLPQACYIEDRKKPYNGERFAVFHYESIPKALEMVKELKGKRTVVILDESHNLNEMVSLRTQRFLELVEKVGARDTIFMTGTPIKALAVETIPLFRAIDPLFTEDAMAAFKKMYAGSVNSATQILARRYNLVSYKVEKAAINLNKPVEETFKVKIPQAEKYTLKSVGADMVDYMRTRMVELTKEMPEATKFFYETLEAYELTLGGVAIGREAREKKDAYVRYLDSLNAVKKAYERRRLHEVVDEMRYCTQYEKTVITPWIRSKEDRDYFQHAKTLVKYVSLKARGECLGRIVGRRRIEAYSALAREIEYEDFIESTDKKTVVFTSYVEAGMAALETLSSLQYKPAYVFGEQTKQLPAIVERFGKDDEVNPLVASYASLSTAVPLIMADTMILINPPFRHHILEQTIARIHRLGATTQTRVFHFTLDTDKEPNICDRTIDIMKWSKEQIDAITGVKAPDEDDTGGGMPAMESISEGFSGIILGEVSPSGIKRVYEKW